MGTLQSSIKSSAIIFICCLTIVFNYNNTYNIFMFFLSMGDDKKNPKLVLVESPFRGDNYNETRDNILYARLCVRDSILRGEAPYASH